MTVISGKIWNYKQHRNLEFKVDGESFFVVGDTDEGKTTLLELIEATLMQKPFEENFITDGEEAGGVEITHDFDGIQYTIKRGRKRNQKQPSRWVVVDVNGGEHKLKDLLERVFGAAFFNAYFDYKKYFYELKNQKDRFEYLGKAIGGEPVMENIRVIKAETDARGKIGTKRSPIVSMLSRSILDPDTLDADMVKYAELKTMEDAYKDDIYLSLKAELKDKELIEIQYDEVKKYNDEFELKTKRIPEIDHEIKGLQEAIANLKKEKKEAEKWVKNNPNDLDLEEKLSEELVTADLFNAEHQPKVEAALRAALDEVNEFNNNKVRFDQAFELLTELKELNETYDRHTQTIESKKEANKKLIQDKVILPGLVLDEENEVVLYDERELCFPNVSKGKSIRITAQIQRAINPKGNNMIIIPEAQSLGSAMDEVIEECNKFNFQYIMEVTKRKQKFQIKFEQDIDEIL